jgi:hypothetical protein
MVVSLSSGRAKLRDEEAAPARGDVGRLMRVNNTPSPKIEFEEARKLTRWKTPRRLADLEREWPNLPR